MSASERDSIDDIVDDIEQDISIQDVELHEAELESEQELVEDLGVGETVAVPVQGKPKKLWFYVAVISLLLAIIIHFVVIPIEQQLAKKQANVKQARSLLSVLLVNAPQVLSNKDGFTIFQHTVNQLDSAITPFTTQATPGGKVYDALGLSGGDKEIDKQWASIKQLNNKLTSFQQEIELTQNNVAQIDSISGKLTEQNIKLTSQISETGNASKDKNKYLLLGAQVSKLNGLLRHVSQSLKGYANPLIEPVGLSTKIAYFVEQCKALMANVSEKTPEFSDNVTGIKQNIVSMSDRLAVISEHSEGLNGAKTTLQQISDQGQSLQQQLSQQSKLEKLPKYISLLIHYLPLLLSLLALFALSRMYRAYKLLLAERSLQQSLEQSSLGNEEQQEAILQLLDEMSALADGDLTVEAEVSNQMTGAIADSVNFAVTEMRDLVSQIDGASKQIGDESQQATESANLISLFNVEQAKQVSDASQRMEQISESIRNMADKAESSSAMAGESNQVATQGAKAVSDTIQQMDDLREQIQETSKRIKRLGESSQRIGDIVALIDDIAEQTNILSLNAAIQASMAGEAGRGFAVVSDEVQSLAERSTEATKKITELVKVIQDDSNDAVLSMEKATQAVVHGAKVADVAGSALAEIEQVSSKLSDSITQISSESTQQASHVTEVSEQIAVVREKSNETSEKAQQSATGIGRLLALAKELQASVARFKLPDNA